MELSALRIMLNSNENYHFSFYDSRHSFTSYGNIIECRETLRAACFRIGTANAGEPLFYPRLVHNERARNLVGAYNYYRGPSWPLEPTFSGYTVNIMIGYEACRLPARS